MKTVDMVHFESECKKYGVSFKKVMFERMLRECVKADGNETGGIIWGKYSARLDDAIVTGFSGAPSDSRMDRCSFARGVAGLQSKLMSLWKKVDKEYYLGEWHYHPFSSPIASLTDGQQMFNHANDPKLRCPEPIMIIIGGDPRSNWSVSVAVYTKAGLSYNLIPKDVS